MSSFETVIFSNLLNNDAYARKVLPFLKTDYFHDRSERHVHGLIDNFITKYNNLPSKEALLIDLENSKPDQTLFDSCVKIIGEITASPVSTDIDWLLDTTEKFCKDKALYNAVLQAVNCIDEEKGALTAGELPKLLNDALGITFDTSVGHDYFEDAETRFENYQNSDERIPFDLNNLNKATNGGVRKKTLNVFLAPSGVGKTLVMTHLAAAHLAMGLNVLYITLEISEERISERIDANLLGINIDDLKTIDKKVYFNKLDFVKSKTKGRLKVKEYPSASISAANIRFLINELKLKTNFVPDVIYIDYLNLMLSARKQGNNANSYTIVKNIAEEVRGLAQEFNVPVFSATQTNKDGYDNSDISMKETSESMGLVHTVDWLCAVMQTDELKELSQYLFKQLKSRYGDLTKHEYFMVAVNKDRMRLDDIDADGYRKDEPPERNDTDFITDTGPLKFKSKAEKFKGFQ